MYFKMGEVTKLVGVQAHVLRYWEKEIPAIRPGHSSANQRRYRRRDVELFREVRRLLYEEKFTLAGARKHLTGPLAPPMPPDPDAFVHDFDADPALNDLTATIAEHDMYSPDLLQEMQETITKTLSDLTTSIQEHDASGSDLLQELHDAITKTSSARPVVAPFARGPVPTAADAIAAHRVSQGAAAYIERAASRAAVVAHVAAAPEKPAEVAAAPEKPAQVAEGADDADLDVDTDTGLPAAHTCEGADAADDLQASNECEDVLAISSYNDGSDADRDLHAWHAGGDPEDIESTTAEAHHETLDAQSEVTDGDPEDIKSTTAEAHHETLDAQSEVTDDSDTFRAWDHSIDPEAEAERLAEEAEQDHQGTYVLYRTDDDGAGPDVTYGSTDTTLPPDIAYASGDTHAGPEIAYVSGETSVTPDVSYGDENAPDPFDVAHASGEADAAFNVFRVQADDSQTIELPCMTPQSLPAPDVAYASGQYGAPEVASDSLHMAGSGLSGLSGLPMAALHFAAQDSSEGEDAQASVGAWGASMEPGHGMHNAAALASALPAACYGAEDAEDPEDPEDIAPDEGVGLQAIATTSDLNAGGSVYHAWHTEAPLDDVRHDSDATDASDADDYAVQEALDDLPDSPYAAFLSADPVTCAWPDTSGSAFDFTPEASAQAAFAPATPDAEVSDDPAVLAAWDALAAIGVEEVRGAQAAAPPQALTREATGAAEASLEASRLQRRDAEVTPTPPALAGRVGAAASFEEGEEPSGGFYAYVEVPADGLDGADACEAGVGKAEAFYTPVEPNYDAGAPIAPKPLTIPSLDAPLPQADAYSEASPTQVVGELSGAPVGDSWAAVADWPPAPDAAPDAAPEPSVGTEVSVGSGVPVAEASNSSAARPSIPAPAMSTQPPSADHAPIQTESEHAQEAVPATPVSPATPVTPDAHEVSTLPMMSADEAAPMLALTPDTEVAGASEPISPASPADAAAPPVSHLDSLGAMAPIMSTTPFDAAQLSAAMSPAEPMQPIPSEMMAAPVMPAISDGAFDPMGFSTSMVSADSMPPIASAAPCDPMPLAAPMVPTETLASATHTEAMPLPAPPPPAVPETSLAAMTPMELMAAVASLRPSKAVPPDGSHDAEAIDAAKTPTSPTDVDLPVAAQAGGLDPAPPVAPSTAVPPTPAAPVAPVLLVPAGAAAATGAAVPRVIVNASRAVSALRGRAFTEVLKSLAGDYEPSRAAPVVAAPKEVEAAPATATNSGVAARVQQSSAQSGDPEDVGADSALADASYGMDLSPEDLANARDGAQDAPLAQTPQAMSSASDADDVAGETLAQTAGALDMANEALADASTAMAAAADAVAVVAADVNATAATSAAQNAANDPQDTEDKTQEVPATPPPFEHPPYFETPEHDTLAVQLLRQKLRSGLQDILRIATE